MTFLISEISQIRENSPAWRAREQIRKGDMLVQMQVLFRCLMY